MKEGSGADSKERDKKDAKGDDKAEDEAFDPTNLDKVSLSFWIHILLNTYFLGVCERI